MANFVYLIGDRETGEAVAVDPAYAPGELVDILGADGMRLTGALVTHYHPDHVGGSMGGWNIAGVSELLALPDNRAKIHIQTEEAWGGLGLGYVEYALVLEEIRQIKSRQP